MSTPIAILAAAAALAGGTPDRVAFARCRSANRHAVMGVCHWRAGFFVRYNGSYSSRILANRAFAIDQLGTAERVEYWPVGVAKVLARSPSIWGVRGRYLICPLRPERGNTMLRERQLTLACVAGARNLVARKIDDEFRN